MYFLSDSNLFFLRELNVDPSRRMTVCLLLLLLPPGYKFFLQRLGHVFHVANIEPVVEPAKHC